LCTTGGEQRRRRVSDGLGGRLITRERRVLSLERSELTHRKVVVGVGDLRRVELVVGVVGRDDQRGEFVSAISGRFRGLRHNFKPTPVV